MNDTEIERGDGAGLISLFLMKTFSHRLYVSVCSPTHMGAHPTNRLSRGHVFPHARAHLLDMDGCRQTRRLEVVMGREESSKTKLVWWSARHTCTVTSPFTPRQGEGRENPASSWAIRWIRLLDFPPFATETNGARCSPPLHYVLLVFISPCWFVTTTSPVFV